MGIVLIIPAVGFWGAWRSYRRVQEVVTTELTLSQPLNILVIGIDSDSPLSVTSDKPTIGQRADVLLLAVIQPDNKEVTLISVPRDSLVEIPGHGDDRINAAHVLGGIPLTMQVVQQVTGLPVHRYLQVDFEGFVQWVDLVGGVEVNVDKRMFYVDNSAGLRIDLKKGPQVLMGRDALGYVRYRQDSLGDIKRVERQQKFVKALLKKVMKPGMLFKVNQLYGIAWNHVKTDLSFMEMMSLARFAQEMGDEMEIQAHTLPGEFEGPCWKLDSVAIAELIQPLKAVEARESVFQEKEKVKVDAD